MFSENDPPPPFEAGTAVTVVPLVAELFAASSP